MTTPPPGRYRVTLTTIGRPAMHGWWDDEDTARRKLATWVGEYGTAPDARVLLLDEDTGARLTEWPEVL